MDVFVCLQLRPLEVLLTIPLLVRSFSHSGSFYSPSVFSVASIALGSGDSEMNRHGLYPGETQGGMWAKDTCAKNYSCVWGAPQSRYLQGRGDRESVWSNTTSKRSSGQISVYRVGRGGRGMFRAVERNMQGHGELLGLEQSSSREEKR